MTNITKSPKKHISSPVALSSRLKQKKAKTKSVLFFKKVNGKNTPTHPWIANLKRGQGAGEVDITGELAQHLLVHFNKENRNVDRMQVKILVTEFRSGEFIANAENLGFSRGTGQIQDGQHRLIAFLEYAKEKSPDDWKNESFSMNVTYSLHPDAKGKTNLGKGRTIFDVSKLRGSELSGTEKKFVTIVKNHKLKSFSGNTTRRDLATFTSILDVLGDPFPADSDETYFSVAKEFAESSYDGISEAVYPLSNGHLQAIYDFAVFVSLEKAREFLYLITAETADIASSGIDHTFDSDALSSIKVCRSYLKQKHAEKPHSGGCFGAFYGTMLYFIQQYTGGFRTNVVKERNLCTQEEYESDNPPKVKTKAKVHKPNFHWGLAE